MALLQSEHVARTRRRTPSLTHRGFKPRQGRERYHLIMGSPGSEDDRSLSAFLHLVEHLPDEIALRQLRVVYLAGRGPSRACQKTSYPSPDDGGYSWRCLELLD